MNYLEEIEEIKQQLLTALQYLTDEVSHKVNNIIYEFCEELMEVLDDGKDEAFEKIRK